MTNSWKQQAKDFLAIADQFKLGVLPTEQPHPKTKGLHQLSKDNLSEAIKILKDIDDDCLNVLKEKFSTLENMHKDIQQTLSSGNKVYLCGCGATGRLALAIERIYREIYPDADNIISFMAGGDVALISSIEEFEDFPQYGARQLKELNFGEHDLLIGSSEGGETPWVIGAVEEASKISFQSPYFLYCNPDEILVKYVERSQRIINNPQINKINLYCQQMALTGSTRMQASTILMLAIGICVVDYQKDFSKLKNEYHDFLTYFQNQDFSWLTSFIEKEAQIYLEKGHCLYQCPDHLGISILTDTTERSPTFSLAPFENQNDENLIPSLCYFSQRNCLNKEDAWSYLLGRFPRTLNWETTIQRTSLERLYGHDISNHIHSLRQSYLKGREEIFHIEHSSNKLHFQIANIRKEVPTPEISLLYVHILLKTLLNTHSTLIMGRLDRYNSNIMTWVKSSNNKLIDRTARNVLYLLEQKNISPSYEEIIFKIFELKKDLKTGEPLVSKVVNSFI